MAKQILRQWVRSLIMFGAVVFLVWCLNTQQENDNMHTNPDGYRPSNSDGAWH